MRFHTHLILASSFFVCVISGSAAQAADCKPLQIINTVKIEPTENGNAYLVPVTINERPMKFLLDTGGSMTQLTGSAANEIGLQVESGVLELTDLNGRVSNKRATTQTIDIGSQRGEKLKIQISPIPDLGPGISGLLSTDLFLQYDIDLDFGANRLNYFSQDHCDGKVAYWAERPLAVVPVSLRNAQINVPVIVDGQEMNAIIDTGSAGTVMSSTTAKSDLKIELGSEDAPVIATSKNNSNFKVYSHKFKALSFEGITVQNPKIDIITDREFSNGDIRRVDKISDVIIGMNVLKHLHLYIAYKEKKLYISPAGTGESVLFKAATAPAN